jgi:hypothetical protein
MDLERIDEERKARSFQSIVSLLDKLYEYKDDKNDWEKLFQKCDDDGGCDVGDGKRLQRVVRIPENYDDNSLFYRTSRDFLVSVQSFLLSVGLIQRNHVADVLSMFYSFPGCTVQHAHKDYNCTSATCVALFAIHTEARLDLHVDGVWVEVVVQPGQMLLFRGDIVHRGCAYTKENTRVHVYINLPGIVSERGLETYFVDVK